MTKSAEPSTPSGSSETQQRRRQITSYKNTTTSPATDTQLVLAAQCARVVRECSARKGRGECRVLDAPAASCAKVESTRVSHHGYTGSPGIPARNGFNGFLRALVSAKSARMCERAALV